MPKKKKKRETISSLKKLAWQDFSKYIRLRDCLITTGSKDRGQCYTCEKEYPFKKLQAGHFIDGRSASVLFDEELVNAQCYACNVMKSGNKDEYTPKMIKKHGLERVEEMWRQKHKIHKWEKDELKEIRQNFKEEFKFLYENN